MRSLNLSEQGTVVVAAVWRNWPSLIHHILTWKEDVVRFPEIWQKSVTLTWQQRDNNVPTASEHYWSIVCFSWRGSFCRQPMILLWPGVRTLTLTSDNVKNCEARKGLLSSFWEPWSRNWRWQGFLLLRSDSKYKRWRGRSIMIKGLTATDIFKVF